MKLVQYHQIVIAEMLRRGYRPDLVWLDPLYRGKNCPAYQKLGAESVTVPIYPEHNQCYLKACLANLEGKGVVFKG